MYCQSLAPKNKYKIVIQKGKLVIEGSEITDWNTEENLGDIIVNDELVRE